MKMNQILLTILCVTIIAADRNLHNLSIRNSQYSRKQECYLTITNTVEIMDIKSNCQNNYTNSQQFTKLLSLINTKAAYWLDKIGFQRGYRYFKDARNYKLLRYNLSNKIQIIKNKLIQLSITLPINFDQQFILKTYWYKDQWHLQTFTYTSSSKIMYEISNQKYQISTSQSQNNHKNLITRKITGTGLRRKVNITLELQQQIIGDNSLVISQIIPESFYIDYDQLRTVDKFQTIDIELPEHASKQYYFRYIVNFNKIKMLQPKKYNYNYHIYLRYPRPGNTPFTQLPLHPIDYAQIVQNNITTITLYEDPMFDRGSANVFNGNSDQTSIVTAVTYIFMIVVTYFSLTTFRKFKNDK